MGEPQIYRERNGKTEKGYTAKMRKNILGKEKEIRFNEDESMHFFSPTGDLLLSLQGEGSRIPFPSEDIELPTNAIITHNHPKALGRSGVMAIGNSFTLNDMATGVMLNAREVRAVTPTYTFSMKRPKGGWNASVEQVMDEYSKATAKVKEDNRAYKSRMGNTETAKQRAKITHWHRINKMVSEKFGWDYTKKKG